MALYFTKCQKLTYSASLSIPSIANYSYMYRKSNRSVWPSISRIRTFAERISSVWWWKIAAKTAECVCKTKCWTGNLSLSLLINVKSDPLPDSKIAKKSVTISLQSATSWLASTIMLVGPQKYLKQNAFSLYSAILITHCSLFTRFSRGLVQ